MWKLFFIALTITIQIYLIEGQKEEICVNTQEYSSFKLPQDGQAFYMETGKYTGRWHYSTPDQWIQKDYLPKDELIDADDNWPMWIWHDCGQVDGYDTVCIESGRYPNYWAYISSGVSLAISYSSSKFGSDWTWTHWYVKKVSTDGYVFLCNFRESPHDPENCNYGLSVFIHVPPSCAGWERIQCCKNLDCTFSYEQGITRESSRSTTIEFGAEISATVNRVK